MDKRKARKLPRNIPGKYHTTDDCEGCAYCEAVAPDNFRFDKPSYTYFVCKQPSTPREVEQVEEACEDCPLDAIQVAEQLRSTIADPLGQFAS